MTRENLHDLLIGAVLVALGYAVYRHFKASQQQAAAVDATQAMAKPGDMLVGDINLTQLLAGTLPEGY